MRANDTQIEAAIIRVEGDDNNMTVTEGLLTHSCRKGNCGAVIQPEWVRSLGQEDPLEEGMAIHSSILARRIPMERGARQATVYGVTKGQTCLSN